MYKLQSNQKTISDKTKADGMFYYMIGLKIIYTTSDWDFPSITDLSSLSYMFYYTPQIVGGNGTRYAGITDSSMAKIDRDGVPGFFTLKE